MRAVWSLLLLAPVARAAPEPVEDLVLVGPVDRQPVFETSAEIRSALASRDWNAAAEGLQRMDPSKMTGAARADHAFLMAWALAHSGRAEAASALLPLAEETRAPEAYLALLRAEVRAAVGDLVGALEDFARVPEDSGQWPRAQIGRAEALRALGRTEDGFAVYEGLVARPGAAPGSDWALIALGVRAGTSSPEGKTALRRVYVEWPQTDAAREAVRLLGAPPRLDASEAARRAEARMEAGDHRGALAETEAWAANPPAGEVGCRIRYVRGRSAYRLNQLTQAAAAFGEAGRDCVSEAGDYGARSLYLQGTAEFRRSRMGESARRYDQLAALYPEHSMADDGLTRAGVALQEAGDLAGAMERWSRALETYPSGDTVPEATWRLAFAHYLDGEPQRAIEIADRLGSLPLDGDALLVTAGTYWAARWSAWPDVDAPTALDESGAAMAADGFRAVLRDHPHSTYATFAWARLAELEPDEAIRWERPADHDRADEPAALALRAAVASDPALRDGADLIRLGLIREGLEEASRADLDALNPEERAWWTDLRVEAGDWLVAHDDFRQYIKSHPIETFGPQAAAILRIAWPDRYWNEVQEATRDFAWEPRLYHALVREESNFNRSIVSFAGAVGLGQLMPATAAQVAGWLGRPVGDLRDPANNLELGAAYFDRVLSEEADNPYLALAAYNAGGGRVDQWIDRYGNVPTDEFVERIPFKETRDYVKRVTGSWQTMRYQFDDGAPFPDLRAFVHRARP
jgi:soluble lytic murein transglycosylase